MTADKVGELEACDWSFDDDPRTASWHTGCGQLFQFDFDGPRENGFNFCHHCGKTLRLVPDDGQGA